MANKGVAALRQFTLGKGKSGGRNSQGRITAFHRGGGTKRLLRRIDLKRSVPGVGIVERIEYDPNRTSKIALVRWVEGAAPSPPRRQQERDGVVDRELALLREKILGSSSATTDGGRRFSFSSLPGNSNRSRAGDVFSSALSSSPREAAVGEGAFVRLPRIAVAAAKPAFFVSRVRGESGSGEEGAAFSLDEVCKWRPDLDVWAHRMKRKAAVSWQSVRHHSTLVGVPRRHGGAEPMVDHGLSAVLSLTGSSPPSSEHLISGPRT